MVFLIIKKKNPIIFLLSKNLVMLQKVKWIFLVKITVDKKMNYRMLIAHISEEAKVISNMECKEEVVSHLLEDK